jgi:GAF domain-containing protein
MLDSDLDLAPDRQITTKSGITARLQYGYHRSIAMPIFAEAAAQAVRLLDAPIAILTTSAGAEYLISAIVGLERLTQVGIEPDLHLALAGLEYCHTQTIGSNGKFMVANLCDDLLLAQSTLHCKHKIQAYLGSPIRTAAGDLLGALSILDFNPRQFSDRESEILHSLGRWSASEFERKLLSQAQLGRLVGEVQDADISAPSLTIDRRWQFYKVRILKLFLSFKPNCNLSY